MADAKAGIELTAIDKTAAAFASARGNLNNIATVAKRVAGVLGVALSARSIANFAADAVRAGDAINEVSRSAGVGAESLQRLRFAFSQLSDTTDDQVDDSLIRFNRLLGDAIQGQGAAVDTLRTLGVQWRETGGAIRNTEAVLEDTLRGLAGIQNPAIRAAEAAALFGREAGPKLASALGQGIDAMEAMREAAPGVLSSQNIQLAAELNDEFDKLARTVGGSLKNAFIEATARAADFFGVVDLSRNAELMLEIRSLQNTVAQLEFADSAGSLGGNIILLERAREDLAEAQRQLKIEQARAAGVGGFATRSFLSGPPPGEAFAREYQLFLRTIQNTPLVKIEGIVNPLLEVGMVADSASASIQRLWDHIMTPPAGNLEWLRNAQESMRNVSLTPERDAEYAAFLDSVIQHNAELATVARLSEAELTSIALSGMAEREQFEAMNMKQRTMNTLGSLAAMTAGTAQSNEKIFKIHKAAALAHAAASLPAAILESFRNAGGWPWGAVAAAGMAAAGAAQIAAIKSSSFGGGTTPSLAGSAGSIGGHPVPVTPALPTMSQPAERRGEIRIEVHSNNFYGPGGAEDFAELVTDVVSSAANDRDVVIISHASRQASIIRGD